MNAEPFQLATLTRTHCSISESSSNLVIKGQVVRGDRGFVEAYVKVLPPLGIIVESLCAWIIREVGIPSPEAFWVQITKSTLDRQLRHRLPSESATVIGFGTMIVPNTMSLRSSSRRSEKLAQQLQRWDGLPLSASFDEVIANTDRNAGNILTNGLGEYWLIDHDRAFFDCVTSPDWGDEQSEAHLTSFRNELFCYIEDLPAKERFKLSSAFSRAIEDLKKAISAMPWDTFGLDPRQRETFEAFLACRSEKLRSLVLARLGVPDLDLGDS